MSIFIISKDIKNKPSTESTVQTLVTTQLATYSASSLLTMMDANCWPLILPEQDPQAPFPIPIALTMTPTSGRAQIQVHHRPSMSNTTNTMMEWPTA